MTFDKNNYSDETAELDGITVGYRAYRNIIFVDNPADDTFHRMNIYAPLSFFNEQSVNGYNIKNAPIFMPNAVGGYRPGRIEEPSTNKTIFYALNRGYVVVSPAIRGRGLKDKNGKNYGCAPACIVDYKAAVRFLRRFAGVIQSISTALPSMILSSFYRQNSRRCLSLFALRRELSFFYSLFMPDYRKLDSNHFNTAQPVCN